jgi:hypothetical protein
MSNRKAARARFLLVPWGCDARILSSLLLRVDEHECDTGTAEMFLWCQVPAELEKMRRMS